MKQVAYRLEEGIGRLTLNRPERHNALVPELLADIREALALCREQQPPALIIDAAGKSFSTGGDVAGFYDTPRPQRREYAAGVVGELNRTILDLLTLPVPTISAVHGLVTGGSIGLVLATDLVVLGPDASFAPWYTVVGYSPDGGWTALLPERIGRARALDIQLTNRSLGAEEAHRTGLGQYLAKQDEELTTAWTLANQIRARQPGSVARTLTLNRPDPERVAAALELEYQQFLEQIETDEADRGMAAFLGRKA